MTIRDRVAIAGVGRTELSKNSGVSTLTLALRAVRAALDDAGLHVRDVDGVATHGVGDSAPAPVVAAALGIRDVAFLLNQSGGGGLSATVVGYAAAAIATGQASVVVCWRAINARSEFRMGGTGRDAPPLAEFQYQVPYGYLAPPQQFAMLARELLDGGALDERVLGTVSVTQRSHAARNPRAMLRTPCRWTTISRPRGWSSRCGCWTAAWRRMPPSPWSSRRPHAPGTWLVRPCTFARSRPAGATRCTRRAARRLPPAPPH